MMDEPSLQLQQNLQDSIKRALSCRRPVLTHLNADTAWLLQLPYPPGVIPPKGRSHFYILIDPWLMGPQVDVAPWFSKQWHSTNPKVRTIVELNECLQDIENLAEEKKDKVMKSKEEPSGPTSTESFIDAVIVSHEFTDHCHKDTLLEIHSDTPVFATKVAANSIRSWDHFKLVHDIPVFSNKSLDWTETLLDSLPKWLGISRIVTKTNILYFHSAILIAFDLARDACMENQAKVKTSEAIIYTPHGIHAQDLHYLPLAEPPLQALALLHGLHEVTISSLKKLNLGAHNGLQAYRTCKAKYWISTHDEVKDGQGLIASLLKRKVLTPQEATEHERGQMSDENQPTDMEPMIFADLRSGESLLLS